MQGIPVDLDEQARTVEEVCRKFEPEVRGNPIYFEAVRRGGGPGYGYIEAQALHSVLRHYKPGRVIEVGSGVSTFCMAEALDRNRKETAAPWSLTCIEPYPRPALQEFCRGRPEIQLVRKPVQEAPPALFETLGPRDLLFIDSSHVAKVGSDVTHLVLEVLPRLREGVIVHVHDIYFP